MKAVKRMNDSGNCVSPAKNRLFDKKTSKIRGQLKVHGKKDSNSAGMSLVVQILTNYCVCCGENKIEYLELDHWLGRNHISYYISDLKNLKSIYIFTDSIQDLTKEETDYVKTHYRILCVNCNGILGRFGFCEKRNEHRGVNAPVHSSIGKFRIRDYKNGKITFVGNTKLNEYMWYPVAKESYKEIKNIRKRLK